MNTEQIIPALMLVTLGAVLMLGIVQFVSFLRSRRNREAAERVFTDGDKR